MENSRERIWCWEKPRSRHDISTQNGLLQKPGVCSSNHCTFSSRPLLTLLIPSAYEIETYWGEVPPPREILEDISAKGGDLRSRTLENFPPPNTPNSRSLAHHGLDGAAEADAQESADEDKLTTPKREKTEPEDLGSAGRYPTRT